MKKKEEKSTMSKIKNQEKIIRKKCGEQQPQTKKRRMHNE